MRGLGNLNGVSLQGVSPVGGDFHPDFYGRYATPVAVRRMRPFGERFFFGERFVGEEDV